MTDIQGNSSREDKVPVIVMQLAGGRAKRLSSSPAGLLWNRAPGGGGGDTTHRLAEGIPLQSQHTLHLVCAITHRSQRGTPSPPPPPAGCFIATPAFPPPGTPRVPSQKLLPNPAHPQLPRMKFSCLVGPSVLGPGRVKRREASCGRQGSPNTSVWPVLHSKALDTLPD